MGTDEEKVHHGKNKSCKQKIATQDRCQGHSARLLWVEQNFIHDDIASFLTRSSAPLYDMKSQYVDSGKSIIAGVA